MYDDIQKILNSMSEGKEVKIGHLINQRKESNMLEIKIALFVVFVLAVFAWQYLDDKKYTK